MMRISWPFLKRALYRLPQQLSLAILAVLADPAQNRCLLGGADAREMET
jgi:hypothetical protein